MPPGNDAITIGPHINFAEGAYDPRTVGGIALIGHEMKHVEQQSKGLIKFVGKYLAEYGANLAKELFNGVNVTPIPGQSPEFPSTA
ncbi:MAG: DUF4157 domain-containing protein, partial [Nitrososphaera sp.]